ncbi:MAG TPA: thioredoxin domain-containing protein [Gemmatimonadaceae bacterium]|nr:thioredoxin domain-containing protein [Gemmatimonadaceae bacterium]
MLSHRFFSVALACCAFACSRGEASPNADNSARAKPGAAAATTPATTTAATNAAKPDTLAVAADHGRVMGSDTASTWLLVVSDFQCPWCKMWHDSTFPALKKEYVDPGKLRVAYINFPLGMHANAWPSALAAMCASAQGKFWPTHDRIFETQATWEKMAKPEAYFDSLAIASGADAARQHECVQKRSTLQLVQADQARASKSGAQTTPTFFVGGAMIEGAQPVKLFRHVIDSVLTASTRK